MPEVCDVLRVPRGCVGNLPEMNRLKRHERGITDRHEVSNPFRDVPQILFGIVFLTSVQPPMSCQPGKRIIVVEYISARATTHREGKIRVSLTPVGDCRRLNPSELRYLSDRKCATVACRVLGHQAIRSTGVIGGSDRTNDA